MNKKGLVAGIIGSTFLLGLGAILVTGNKVQANTRGPVSLVLEDVEAGECPDYFNILCTIKSKTVAYDEVKNKDLVLSYEVNGQFQSKEKMKMEVVEYEEDGETPKVVCFTSEIVGREKAWVPYTIYTIDKNQVYDKIFSDFSANSYAENQKQVFESDIYECGFSFQEKTSKFDTVVDLKSSELKVADLDEEEYTEITYSINGGEEKTVYAHREVNMLPDSAVIETINYEAQIFANKGDVIEYKVVVPTKDKEAVYEETKNVVVK
ncbi:MAG: hypothetical protein E7262_02995 [Lachnospiraceae bacterium]|nr:hypothetical protein [Lachnospiraceae bacterium]